MLLAVSVLWLAVGLLTLAFVLFVYVYSFRYHQKGARWYAPEKGYYELKMPGKRQFTLLIVGDAGKPATDGTDPVMRTLDWHLREAGRESVAIFLGDNIYPRGLPDIESRDRPQAEAYLCAQLDLLKSYEGKPYFLLGNHDWHKGKTDGIQFAQRQAAFITKYLGKEDAVQPPRNCLGPEEFVLHDKLALIIINTQWFVQRGPLPKDCDPPDQDSFFLELEKALERHKDKRIIIAGHHPLYSYALHGGYFDYKRHLFPLTALHRRLLIPLPLIGSIYPLFRKVRGPREDISHPLYRRMRRRLLALFKKYPGLVYASGHDHSLQHIYTGEQHYLISGTGSKFDYVKQGSKARFVSEMLGFFKLQYHTDGSLWIEAWAPSLKHPEGRLLYLAKME